MVAISFVLSFSMEIWVIFIEKEGRLKEKKRSKKNQ